jgi:hypothetical protein
MQAKATLSDADKLTVNIKKFKMMEYYEQKWFWEWVRGIKVSNGMVFPGTLEHCRILSECEGHFISKAVWHR